MDPIYCLLLFACFFTYPFSLTARTTTPPTRITVVGAVYCDSCSSNAFTKHSYFLPGVEVQIRCKFRVKSPETTEEMNLSVNRTTNRYGVYKLDIAAIRGVNCLNGLALVSMCQATLIGASSLACNVPSLRTTSNEISIKSEQDNLCIYSLNALSYKPSKKNNTLCANKKEELANALDSSKCFLPWLPLQKLPFPFPSLQLPPLPPLSSLPWPFQLPPSLPFPFPQTSLPPSPAFSLGDPTTWFPFGPAAPPP
ncbi:hypothetical protein UlMin_039949 [Ulmus minor]